MFQYYYLILIVFIYTVKWFQVLLFNIISFIYSYKCSNITI